MTEKRLEFLAAQRRELFIKQFGRCASCGIQHRTSGDMELAHKVAETKANIRRWGIARIDNVRNKALVCRETLGGRSCNDRQNIGNDPEASRVLMESIGEELGIEEDVLW